MVVVVKLRHRARISLSRGSCCDTIIVAIREIHCLINSRLILSWSVWNDCAVTEIIGRAKASERVTSQFNSAVIEYV